MTANMIVRDNRLRDLIDRLDDARSAVDATESESDDEDVRDALYEVSGALAEATTFLRDLREERLRGCA